MNLLALDTSSIACSVALKVDNELFERHVVKPKEHTRLLIPMIEDVLADAGANLRDLDALVLGNGPGSFIGIRIAASVGQGLCYGAGLKLVPVSSLAAVAAESLHVSPATRIAVAEDAHMNEIYLACFLKGEGGLPLADGDAVLQPIGIIERIGLSKDEDSGSARWHAAGAGWHRYPELLRMNDDRLAGVVDVQVPRARFLLDLGQQSFLAGQAIDAELLVPAYVRTRVAA